MNLITHICWLLILHLPVYSQASNHAESSFRFGPDNEYKYGTVPKRKDKREYNLRAYYTYPPKWKPKNIDNPKFIFFNQNLGYTKDESDIHNKRASTEYLNGASTKSTVYPYRPLACLFNVIINNNFDVSPCHLVEKFEEFTDNVKDKAKKTLGKVKIPSLPSWT